MRATIRALAIGLSVTTLAFSGCAGIHCLHRPCNAECAASFNSPRPQPTMKTGRPTWRERLRISRLWEKDETPRDITVRPETTPLPGAQLETRADEGGVLGLPPVNAKDEEAD